jgi:hypothetical protein
MLRRLTLVVLFAASMTTMRAQQEAPPQLSPDAPYVLHVYQNLVQIVTLVVTTDGKIVPPIPKSKFAITIDSGPPFPPTQMHMEGDDPLDLAILLDDVGDQQSLLKKLPSALDSLTPDVLHPEDHIAVYAYDCDLIRSARNVPATADAIGSAVTRALAAPTLHGTPPHHTCGKVSMWDAVESVTRALSSTSGRRVLLVISDGNSRRGQHVPQDTIEYVQEASVAVFGMRSLGTYNNQHLGHGIPRDPQFTLPEGDGTGEYLFDLLCQRSGGALETVSERSLPKTMQHFVSMLRNRYILEFPRPDGAVAGKHVIDITIPKTKLYIRPAGLSLPAAAKRDPNTLPSTPSPATFGDRRPPDPR